MKTTIAIMPNMIPIPRGVNVKYIKFSKISKNVSGY